MRKVDITKKSNIKCEHCLNFNGGIKGICKLTTEIKNYYNRCKRFEWNKKIKNQDACVGEGEA